MVFSSCDGLPHLRWSSLEWISVVCQQLVALLTPTLRLGARLHQSGSTPGFHSCHGLHHLGWSSPPRLVFVAWGLSSPPGWSSLPGPVSSTCAGLRHLKWSSPVMVLPTCAGPHRSRFPLCVNSLLPCCHQRSTLEPVSPRVVPHCVSSFYSSG